MGRQLVSNLGVGGPRGDLPEKAISELRTEGEVRVHQGKKRDRERFHSFIQHFSQSLN